MNKTDRISKVYITIGHGMGGYYAVMRVFVEEWDEDWGEYRTGYWDNQQTGVGRYSTPEEAAEEGRDWAEAEGIKFEMKWSRIRWYGKVLGSL